MEDTSLLYGDPGAEQDMDPEDLNANDAPDMDSEDSGPASPEPPDGAMVDTLALMDTLQTLGVDVVQANRFVTSLLRSSPTLIELYGRGKIKDMANGSHRNLNIVGVDALDLRTRKPSGDAWDFSKKQDRLEALALIRERRPTWVIGSPPCTAFSIIMGLTYKKMTPARAKQLLELGKLHLHVVIKIYEFQLAAGRNCLHEHPQGHPHGATLSWSNLFGTSR